MLGLRFPWSSFARQKRLGCGIPRLKKAHAPKQALQRLNTYLGNRNHADPIPLSVAIEFVLISITQSCTWRLCTTTPEHQYRASHERPDLSMLSTRCMLRDRTRRNWPIRCGLRGRFRATRPVIARNIIGNRENRSSSILEYPCNTMAPM